MQSNESNPVGCYAYRRANLAEKYAKDALATSMAADLQSEPRSDEPGANLASNVKSSMFDSLDGGQIPRVTIDYRSPVTPLRKNAESVAKRHRIEVPAAYVGPRRAMAK
jgi:hypothetical protein